MVPLLMFFLGPQIRAYLPADTPDNWATMAAAVWRYIVRPIAVGGMLVGAAYTLFKMRKSLTVGLRKAFADLWQTSEDQAGLAAALITASFQLGSALGLAVFTGIATSRTSHLLAAHTPPPEALTAGFQRALLVSALCLVAAGAIALRASNTRGEPAATPETQQNLEPSYDPA